jgi:thiaminase
MDEMTYIPFSREAWDRNARIYEAIRAMPFNAELAAGTLSEARFKHYITQDAHYLVGFGRALTLAAAKAPDPDRIVHFAKSAEGAIVVERALHGSFSGTTASRRRSSRRRRTRRPATITFHTSLPRRMRSLTRCCSARCCPASGSMPRWDAIFTRAPRR